jgi:hypothetical protein
MQVFLARSGTLRCRLWAAFGRGIARQSKLHTARYNRLIALKSSSTT